MEDETGYVYKQNFCCPDVCTIEMCLKRNCSNDQIDDGELTIKATLDSWALNEDLLEVSSDFLHV